MRYLGIDYGKRKVGLAISEGVSASPYKVIEVSGLKNAIEQLRTIIEKERINQVVIGIPESGESLKITEYFINQLKNIPARGWDIIEVDETLTSQQALKHLIKMELSKKKRQLEDAYSAAIILQNYLDQVR